MTDFPTEQDKDEIANISHKIFTDLTSACDAFGDNQGRAVYAVLNRITVEVVAQFAMIYEMSYEESMKVHCDKLVTIMIALDKAKTP